MSFSLIYLVLLVLAALGGAGLIGGGVLLLMRENKVVGGILLALGFLMFLCPLALGALMIFNLQFM